MLLLIRPYFFTTNMEALHTNNFMSTTNNNIQQKALEEHDGLIDALHTYFISHCVYNNENPQTPDALYANNWISVHPNKRIIIIYPMLLNNRKLEVRQDIISDIEKKHPSCKIIDLQKHTKALEGTGSMVIDNENKIIYAGISPRTDPSILQEVASHLDYKVVSFYTNYKQTQVYHTNVMMAIGKDWIVICTNVIEQDDLKEVMDHLTKSGKYIIVINTSQMEAFCGNIFEVYDKYNKPYTIMSTRAYKAFKPSQLDMLGHIIHVPLDTIETYGGGGVRCCLTDIW